MTSLIEERTANILLHENFNSDWTKKFEINTKNYINNINNMDQS
jgi:hypothetical protein